MNRDAIALYIHYIADFAHEQFNYLINVIYTTYELKLTSPLKGRIRKIFSWPYLYDIKGITL